MVLHDRRGSSLNHSNMIVTVVFMLSSRKGKKYILGRIKFRVLGQFMTCFYLSSLPNCEQDNELSRIHFDLLKGFGMFM